VKVKSIFGDRYGILHALVEELPPKSLLARVVKRGEEVRPKAITQLARRGVIAPAPKGRYHVQASVYSYCAFLRAMIGQVESSEEQARE
jgi:hypothetical protein